MKAMNLSPAAELVNRLSYRVGQLEQNGFPWQRKDADLLREARDHLFAIVMHVRMNGEDLPEQGER